MTMTLFEADLDQLRSEMEAFIHLLEMLAQCKEQTHLKINPDAVQRLARVINLHISNAVAKLYGIEPK